MKKTVFFAVVLSFMLSSFVSAQDTIAARGIVLSKLTKESNFGIAADAIVKSPSYKEIRGFTTGVSKEKGSFLLGSDFYGLEIFILANNKNEAIKITKDVINDLKWLGAPVPLITAAEVMDDSIKSAIDVTNIRSTGIPIIKPFLDDFIVKEGDALYYAFGEWIMSADIAAFIGEKVSIDTAIYFLKNYNSADYFLAEFKKRNVPKGIIDSLKTIAELKAKEKLGEKDVKTLSKAITTIYEVML